MRVLHAVTLHTPSHAFGGPTRVALGLCRGLAERGERATLLALGDEFPAGPLPRSVEGARVRLFRARHVLPRFEVSGITSPALLARALGYVRSADVVHVHLMRDLVTLPVALLALRAGTPLVLQTHGMVDPTENRVARLVDGLGVRRVLRRADAVLHLTERERRETAAVVAPAPIAPAHRLVNGVPARERAPAPTGPPRLLYLARVQAGKRPGDFVGAMPTVLARHPDARFTLAGPDTGALAETVALAEELGVRHALDVVGALDGPRVLAALREASALVLPSTRDAFPLSVLEAMSVGTPVVVTATNGLAPDVAAAGAGRVVPATAGPNGPAVGRAVRELLAPPAREHASRAAWALTRDRFTLDAVVERLSGIYREVLDRRGS
ncbi:Glycosyltransferase involved in cell wall bisynthesis [Streptomyces zhaozhouensis]|uniref:D-inositol 3-phosphate glycosyltransferase n=1 Tax=Streptomyces zhaozhouensis TaxID=1300267 RepID=A0A286DK95_9ACTN|nr:glycosyltransferase [Streptomyces zhaozhouensis]SOD59003.1 Glycosyltransferase involved in cell wall bisynthesis [Streptomyces zhaozhouensis]